MLMLLAATVVFLVAIYVLWRRTQPAAAPRAPKAPRAPREPGESRLPKLPRRDRSAEVEPPVEMSAARLARISARPPLERLTETGDGYEPAPIADAPVLVAEREAETFQPTPAEPAPPSEADRDMVTQMLGQMVAQVEHEADLIERRGTEPVAVRLVAQIPPRSEEIATSWLGGRPRLDPGMAWPEIREVPGQFIAQIACAALPADIWDGLGPRRGSIALFIHPRDGDAALVHVHEAGDPVEPPHPLDPGGSFFAPHGGLRFGDLMPFARAAFPEWPVDLVAVRPGDPDPRTDEEEDGDEGFGYRLYRGGYDIADPAFHPFDWDSMTAMVDILAMRIDRFWKEVEGPSPIDTQLASVERRLTKHDAGDKDALGREGLVLMRTALEELRDAADAARAANYVARIRAEEIIGIVRESAPKMAFSASDAAAVMEALHAIRWTKVNRKPDPEGRPGAELIESLTIPLTQHHVDAPLWVHDYLSIWFDHAKHAYAANPGALSDAARAVLEPWFRDLAGREMPSIGHIPFRYVHEFEEKTHATLLELPTSGLMSWTFGDVDHLVVTLRKADLAAGRWDRPMVQVSN
jgi:hypothetical protein